MTSPASTSTPEKLDNFQIITFQQPMRKRVIPTRTFMDLGKKSQMILKSTCIENPIKKYFEEDVRLL